MKNYKFCKESEILYDIYNSEVTYEISGHRCAHLRPYEAQKTHARTRYTDALSTKAISEKSLGEQKVNEW